MLPFTQGHWVKFAIEMVEGPMANIGEVVADKFPVPTKQNTYKHNTHILIDLRDWFFQHRKKDGRSKVIWGLMNFAISKVERDDYYSDIVKVLFREALKKSWDFTLSNNFAEHWNEEIP